jgi:hypothetical protein
MIRRPTRVRLLQLAVLLVTVFDLMALVVLVRETPIAFTLFMFVGQALFLVGLAILVGVVLADLRATELG